MPSITGIAYILTLAAAVLIGGCASDPKPRITIDAGETTGEGPSNSARVGRSESGKAYASSHGSLPQSSSSIDAASEIHKAGPVATDTFAIDFLGAKLDLSNTVEIVEGDIQFDVATAADGTKDAVVKRFRFDRFGTSPKDTLSGLTAYQGAFNTLAISSNEATRDAFNTAVEHFAANVLAIGEAVGGVVGVAARTFATGIQQQLSLPPLPSTENIIDAAEIPEIPETTEPTEEAEETREP